MRIDLSGNWHISLNTTKGLQEGTIHLPGILQANGYGEDISEKTPWVSGLHDQNCWQRDEYQQIDDVFSVPFLSQPPKHFIGTACYSRNFKVTDSQTEPLVLFLEATRWKSTVFIDGVKQGSDISLCTPHVISCSSLQKGEHNITIEIDNSMQYPYRPDGHGVTDATAATWNGIVGKIELLAQSEYQKQILAKQYFAQKNPRTIEVIDGKFYVDGKIEYFRGTHFAGEFPLTGSPAMDKNWWENLMQTLKKWGLNFIRFHSYCPPEVAFETADEANIYLQVECGMWNRFEPNIDMLNILQKETQRILKTFGHHPSFVLFSPTNEPSGNWYQVLKDWVSQTKDFDKTLGYQGRRVYTAQSGWFYDVAPKDVTGCDYLYFHRSNFGPLLGGNIRNSGGWKGKDYYSSIENCSVPIISHELGQWCAYPNFKIIDKFKGYLQARNLMLFQENCRKNGLLHLNEDFSYASGKNQVRLYKEDLEATFRTKGIYGFELLDLHDYLGQGTALIGLLDPFWEEKGYITAQEFKQFCDETVLLARLPRYTFHTKKDISIPIEISHFGKENIENTTLSWSLINSVGNTLFHGELKVKLLKQGHCTCVGNILLPLTKIQNTDAFTLQLCMNNTSNSWDIYVYQPLPQLVNPHALYTKHWIEAKQALQEGKSVIYAPSSTELSYNCPPLSIKNVFWNGQMGPTWGRNLGLLIDETHPLFDYFPTERTGGWQWEEILEHSRGFCLAGMPSISPIVRPIDDWNRNLPLGLIFEARVDKGKLFVVSCDLEQNLEAEPATAQLKHAVFAYTSSSAFAPSQQLSFSQIEEHLLPVLKTQAIVETIEIPNDCLIYGKNSLLNPDPNTVTQLKKSAFPISFICTLKAQTPITGIAYLPDQRDRIREGFIKDLEIYTRQDDSSPWKMVYAGELKNSSLQQKAMFKVKANAYQIKICVLSCYGSDLKNKWYEDDEGYKMIQTQAEYIVKMAAFHILSEEISAIPTENIVLSSQHSTTAEIDN